MIFCKKRSFYFFLPIIFLLYSCENEKIPVLGEAGHTIPDFEFINQDGEKVTQATLNGKIYVADFFFTSCPTICPIMKKQLLRVQEKFKTNNEIRFLSHTIDPRHDSASVLKEYAERIGADTKQWIFVTGKKEDIYSIAKNSYDITPDKTLELKEDKNVIGGFVHSGALVLVDKEHRVRGLYDGTKKEEVDKLMQDMETLLSEYKK